MGGSFTDFFLKIQNISLYTFHGQNAASNSSKIIAMKVLNKSNSNPRVKLGDLSLQKEEPAHTFPEGKTDTANPFTGETVLFKDGMRVQFRLPHGNAVPIAESVCKMLSSFVFILDGFGFVVFPISDVFPYFPVIVKGPYPLRAGKGRKRGKERGSDTTARNRRTNCQSNIRHNSASYKNNAFTFSFPEGKRMQQE